MQLIVFLAASFAFFPICIPKCLASHEKTLLVSKLAETRNIELGDIPPGEPAVLTIRLSNDSEKEFSLNRVSKVCGCTQVTNPSRSSISPGESFTFEIKLIRNNADESRFQRRITLVSSQGEFAIDMVGTFRRQIEITPSNVYLSGKPQTVPVSIRTYPEQLRDLLTFRTVSEGIEVSKTASSIGELLLTIEPDKLQLNGITQSVFIDSYENGMHRQRLTLTLVDTSGISVRPEKPTFAFGPESCNLKLFIAGVDLSHSDDLTVQVIEPKQRVLRLSPTIQVRRVSGRLCIVGVECRGFDLRKFSEPLLLITSKSIGLNLEIPCRLPENLSESKERTSEP